MLSGFSLGPLTNAAPGASLRAGNPPARVLQASFVVSPLCGWLGSPPGRHDLLHVHAVLLPYGDGGVE